MKKLFLLSVIFAFVLLVAKFPIYAAPPIGNYLVINGGYVKATIDNPISPTFFAFHTKIYPASVSGKQVILSIGDKSAGKLYYEVSINGGSLSLAYNSTNGSFITLNGGNISSGIWQDIGVQISSTQTILYKDELQIMAPFINNSNFGPIGPNIVVGDNFKESFSDSKPYKGLLDEVFIGNGSTYLLWHLDEARGATIAHDSSSNHLDGTLVGGDSLIHFFGVLPSPTPTPTIFFGLRPIQWTRPVLPTLNIPNPINPNPSPTGVANPPPSNPTPTTYDRLSISNRTQIPRPSLPQSIFPNSGGTVNTCPPIPGHFCAD